MDFPTRSLHSVFHKRSSHRGFNYLMEIFPGIRYFIPN